jgi:hypothetical protein
MCLPDNILEHISAGGKLQYIDFNTHATSMIYQFVNLFVTAMPVRIYHCFHALIFTLLYIFFTVLFWSAGGTNAIGKDYVYSIQDWNDPGPAGLMSFLIGVVGVIVVWLVIYGLYRMRLAIYNAILKRRQSMAQAWIDVKPKSTNMLRIQDPAYIRYTTGIQNPAYVTSIYVG